MPVDIMVVQGGPYGRWHRLLVSGLFRWNGGLAHPSYGRLQGLVAYCHVI